MSRRVGIDADVANVSGGGGSGSQYMQPFSNFIGQMVNVAREKVLGEAWWVPSNQKAIVEIPDKVFKTLVPVVSKDNLHIYKSPGNQQPAYHLVLEVPNSLCALSLYRTNDSDEAHDLLNTYASYSTLFALIRSRKQIESLMRCIKHHSLWQPVHIASMLGLTPYFEMLASDKTKAVDYLNRMCQPEGRYPLHLAVESCHVELALYMIEKLEVPLSQTDVHGQNVFHYAARTNPAIITSLAGCQAADKPINALSKDGYTPLFLTITSCKPTCTAALIKQGAVWDVMCNGRSAVHQAMLQDGSKVKDLIKTLVEASPEMIKRAELQTGNSALHIAGTKQSLLALLTVCKDIDLNMRNYAGQTALHLHVHADNLGCVMALYYSGADFNVQDANGDTCLHIAVSACNVLMTKALLVLGADPNLVNKNGDSPRHVAARLKMKGVELLRCLILGGARPCSLSHSGCTIGCSSLRRPSEVQLSIESPVENFAPNFDSVLESFKLKKCIDNVKNQCRLGKKLHVLFSLDGGGIRGLILVQILLRIEAMLKRPLLSYVDWMAGTSTGSFLAVGLCKGNSLRDCQRLYLRMKDVLFEHHKRPYDTDEMERQIKGHIGEFSRLEDIVRPKLIVTAVVADKHPVRLHMFRSYRLPGDLERSSCADPDSESELPLWKILRCSSAAPTYFSSVNNKFVDGGLIANNPSLDLMAEIEQFNVALEYSNSSEKIEIGCLVSVGTGRIPDMPIDSLDLAIANPIDMMGAFKNLGYMIMDQVTATEGRPVDRARAWCNQIGAAFFRFSTHMEKDYAIDSKNDADLVSMMWETVEYMHKRQDDCALLVDLLEHMLIITPS